MATGVSRRMALAAAWAAALLLLIGCGGGSKSVPAAEVDAAPWVVSAESPLGEQAVILDADSLEAEPQGVAVPMAVEPAPQDSAGASVGAPQAAPATVPGPKDFTPGWRVQISAFSNLVDADARARAARSRFTEPVYVEYEPPFYKVRVGDFLTRAEAESMATRARAEGYEGAWVVETLVMKPAR